VGFTKRAPLVLIMCLAWETFDKQTDFEEEGRKKNDWLVLSSFKTLIART
jgi:hypothetical protein